MRMRLNLASSEARNDLLAFKSRLHVRPYRFWPCVIVLLSACHFDTQPLFEPSSLDGGITTPGELAGAMGSATDAGLIDPPGSVVYGDAGSGDSGVLPPADAGPGNQPGTKDDASTTSCPPGAVMSCSAGTAVTCNAAGDSYVSVACAAGCAANGLRCNECQPNARSCRGTTLKTCSADGRVATDRDQACAMGCGAGADGNAACFACTPGTGMCSNGSLMRCAADGQWQITVCATGCDDAALQCTDARLIPTNLPAEVCLAQDLDDVDFDSNTELDSDNDDACALVLPQGDGTAGICVLAFGKIQVRKDVTVRIRGTRAIALVATEDAEIEGVLSVSASGATAGPGAARGTGVGGTALSGTAINTVLANAAGGGGGYGTTGAVGGSATVQCTSGQCALTGGAGGAVFGNAQLSPLLGGAAGGRNSLASSANGEAPGGGGGALQLVACKKLTLAGSAVIEANGGGGSGGLATTSTEWSGQGQGQNRNEFLSGGAGGGSGGAILIQARTLTAKAGATIVANGGGGGGGAGRMGAAAGAVRPGQAGADGVRGTRPAAGGAAVGDSAPGGAGGALGLPVPGGESDGLTQSSGGGGGAAGRIRVETGVAGSALMGLVVSPIASEAPATLQ